MKLTIARKDLVAGLKKVTMAVPLTNGIRLIYESVKMTVEDGQLVLRATDLDTFVEVKVPVKPLDIADAEGGAAVRAKPLAAMLKKGPKLVDLESTQPEDGKNAVVTDWKLQIDGCVELLGEDPEEYPALPEMPKAEELLSIDGRAFKRHVGHVLASAATEATRYAMNSIQFSVAAGALKLVATDGRRLAVSDVPEVANGQEATFLFPAKALGRVVKVLDDDGAYEVVHDDQTISVVGARNNRTQFRAWVRKDEKSAFPKRQDIPHLPENYGLEVSLPRQETIDLLERLRPLTNLESRSIRMTLENDELTFETRAFELGQAKAKMPVRGQEEKWETGLMLDYLVDGLKAGDEEVVEFRFKPYSDGQKELWNTQPIALMSMSGRTCSCRWRWSRTGKITGQQQDPTPVGGSCYS